MAKPEKSNPDPYGNLGAVADASWAEKWMRFSLADRDRHLASVAHWGPLDLVQMEHLIQGLLPPFNTWLAESTCMTEFMPMITRLRQDIERRAFPQAPTPNEFAAWCDQMGVALPEPLVQGLQNLAMASPAQPVPQSTIAIIIPAWVPNSLFGCKPTRRKKKPRGRPSTGQANCGVLIQEGQRILMDAARAGQKMTIREVAKALQELPCGQDMSTENIERRIKGKLPIAQARATAGKHALKSRVQPS